MDCAPLARALSATASPVDPENHHQGRVTTTSAEGNPHVVLNFITPHQKWGIHSTYTDNLLMLTLNRGGPVGSGCPTSTRRRRAFVDNDWVEASQHRRRADGAEWWCPHRIKQGALSHVSRAGKDPVNLRPVSEKDRPSRRHPNSVTRTTLKPHPHRSPAMHNCPTVSSTTGTVGSIRDEFVIRAENEEGRLAWIARSRSATQKVEAAE